MIIISKMQWRNSYWKALNIITLVDQTRYCECFMSKKLRLMGGGYSRLIRPMLDCILFVVCNGLILLLLLLWIIHNVFVLLFFYWYWWCGGGDIKADFVTIPDSILSGKWKIYPLLDSPKFSSCCSFSVLMWAIICYIIISNLKRGRLSLIAK